MGEGYDDNDALMYAACNCNVCNSMSGQFVTIYRVELILIMFVCYYQNISDLVYNIVIELKIIGGTLAYHLRKLDIIGIHTFCSPFQRDLSIIDLRWHFGIYDDDF